VVAPFFKKITFYYSARKSEIDWTRRKNETFYFTFLKDFFTTGCLGFGSRKSLLHTHTDIPKCVRGPPEEGGCLLKKASPLLFSFPPPPALYTISLVCGSTACIALPPAGQAGGVPIKYHHRPEQRFLA
jgi:hypothetical protein